MNAIDDVGLQLDVKRKKLESDYSYSVRILEHMYGYVHKCNHLSWHSEREENDVERWAVLGEWRAYIWRQDGIWWYTVYHGQTGKVMLRGATKNVEIAQQLCSVALSDKP